MFKKFNAGKVGLFVAGLAFGTAGIKILTSKDAKKVYTGCTAAVLRAKDTVVKTATTVQENAGDILAEAKQINADRAAAEAYVEDEEVAEAEETQTEEAPGRIIMKFVIKHEIKGRLRVHMAQQRMTYEQADVLQYYLQQSDLVVDAKVYEQTADVVISYNGDRAAMIHLLCTFKYQMVEVPEGYLESTGRELNSEYKEKLICKVVWHYGKKLILPAPIRNVITIVNGIRYIWKGLQSLRHRRLDVAVLDATGLRYHCFVRIWERQVLSCSCLASANCSRSGRIKNPSAIWHAACL